jgi:hypothetical protein
MERNRRSQKEASNMNAANWCMQIPWPIAKLALLKDRAVGAPKVHNITGVETEDWIDYSFTLKASAAFGLLQTAGKIPQDAVLQTFGEDVPYDAEEGQLDLLRRRARSAQDALV